MDVSFPACHQPSLHGRDRQSKAAPVSRLSVLEASPSKGRFQQPWGIHSLGQKLSSRSTAVNLA